MNIGILKAGTLPTPILQAKGDYDVLIGRLIGAKFSYSIYDVVGRQMPTSYDDDDAYIISGSSASVYDKDKWIQDLISWLRLAPGNKPIFGICFGHQVMAEAYGGRVERSASGLLVGYQDYDADPNGRWANILSKITLPVTHYDQIAVPPPDASILISNGVTPYAGLEYAKRRCLSLQAHPEFDRDISREVIARWVENGSLSLAQAEASIGTLRDEHSGGLVADQIRSFLIANRKTEYPPLDEAH